MDNHKVRVGNSAYFVVVKQRLDEGDQVQIPVVGKSMQPFLRERDEVLLKAATEVDVTIGDIVLAKWKDGYVLHRVVRKKREWLWLAGDNNLVQLEKVAGSDILAVLVAAEREGKPLQVARPMYKTLGVLWYYIRFPRRVLTAVKRRL